MSGRDTIIEIDAVFADLDLALDRLFKITGDNRVRHAAHVLRGRKSGRAPIDDSAALAEVERLISGGKPLRDAISVAARRFTRSGADEESTKHRLRKKIRTKMICPDRICVSLADDGK